MTSPPFTSGNWAKDRVVDYLEGIHLGDVERLERALHEQVRMYCATDVPLLELVRPRYLEIVRNGPSPASRGDARHDCILSIEVATPHTAHARVRCAYLPKLFTDELTLVNTGAGWRVISKVWHYDLVGPGG